MSPAPAALHAEQQRFVSLPQQYTRYGHSHHFLIHRLPSCSNLSPSGSVHLTGTFPRFATVPQSLSPVFRHASYGYSGAQSSWEVAPAVNWTMLSIANQGMCGEWCQWGPAGEP